MKSFGVTIQMNPPPPPAIFLHGTIYFKYKVLTFESVDEIVYVTIQINPLWLQPCGFCFSAFWKETGNFAKNFCERVV